MTIIRSSIVFFIIFCTSLVYSQKKILNTKSITTKISIDGKIMEDAWNSTEIATDFVMYQPDNGKPISENKKTEVRVLYDNDAIYIAATLYDEDPSKIKKEITNRDSFWVT